jgi:hypothetical protein
MAQTTHKLKQPKQTQRNQTMSDFLDSLLSDYKAEDYLEGYAQAPGQAPFIPDNTFVEVLVTGAEYNEENKSVKYSFATVKPQQFSGIVVRANLPLDSSAHARPSYEPDQTKWEKKVVNSRKKFFAVDAALGSKVTLALQGGKPLTASLVGNAHTNKKLIILVGVYEDDRKISRNYLNGTGVKGSVVESTATAPAARQTAPVAQAPRPAAVEVTQDNDGDEIPF